MSSSWLTLVLLIACSSNDGGMDMPTGGMASTGGSSGQGATGGSGGSGAAGGSSGSGGSAGAAGVTGGSGGGSGASGTGGSACDAGFSDDGSACVPAECPSDCSDHGTCDAGECSCEAGYAGDACEDCAPDYHRGEDGTTCTQSRCDPDPCPASLECQPETGSCCAAECDPGASECVEDEQHQCVLAASSGCFEWSDWSACGAEGCADDEVCAPLAPGVVVEQWGTDEEDRIYDVIAGEDGEAIVAGLTRGSLEGQPMREPADLFVASRNVVATDNWTVQRGSNGADFAWAVARTSDGEILVAGFAEGSVETGVTGIADVYLARHAADGTVLSTTRWGSTDRDEAIGVAADEEGSALVVGQTRGELAADPAGELDVFLSKVDGAGEVEWSQQWGTTLEDSAINVAVDGDGSIYVVGYTEGDLDGESAGGIDAFLSKRTAAGAHVWTRQWGSVGQDVARGIVVQGDAVFVAGNAGGALGGSGSGGAFLGKWNGDGDELWLEQWGPAGAAARDVAVDSSGALIVGGWSNAMIDDAPNAGSRDAFVSRWTHSGETTRAREWSVQYGSTGEDLAYSMAVGADDTIYVAGQTRGSFPGFTLRDVGGDLFLLRIEP